MLNRGGVDMLMGRLPKLIFALVAFALLAAYPVVRDSRDDLHQIRTYLNEKTGQTQQPADLTDSIHNSTLGFQKIFVVGLASRTDRRDSMVLAAALSNLDIEFIDGVAGQDVPDKAIPSYHQRERLSNATVGSWRAHMNAIQEVVRRNLTSALVMEDDADWDVRVKDQFRSFALAVRALTQPLAGTTDKFADATFPRPTEGAPGRTTDMFLTNPPKTEPPTYTPYGDHWDLLWTGHCGMRFADFNNKIKPKGRVVQYDNTVPEQQHLRTLTNPDELKEQYSNHTRVTHHAQNSLCSLGYAMTQKGARQLLWEIGLKELKDPFDVLLQRFCEGNEGIGYHTCLTMQPSILQHYRPAGSMNAESDISPHGDGFRATSETSVVRYSVRLNAETIMEGRTDYKDQWPDA